MRPITRSATIAIIAMSATNNAYSTMLAPRFFERPLEIFVGSAINPLNIDSVSDAVSKEP